MAGFRAKNNPGTVIEKKKVKSMEFCMLNRRRAILFSHCLFHKMGVINSVYIIASDIDQKVIKQAQLGIYSIKGMANISNEMIKVNFKKEDNNYIINDRIKDKVDFKIPKFIRR